MTCQSVQICADVCKVVENNSRWRPDSCRSWFVCAASLISVVVVAGIAYSFGLLLPILMDAFEATRQETAWIGTLYMGCAFFVSLFGSYITDRFSYRFSAILGSISGIMGFSLASLGSQLWMMYLTFGLMSGIGHGLIFNSSFLVILQYFVNWRSLAVGIVASAPAIGMFAITQTTQMLLSTFGWRGTLRGYAFLFFVCGLCATVFTPLDQFKKESKDSNSAGIRQRESKTSSLFRNRYFLILFTSLFVVHMSYFVPTIHIVKHCIEELQVSEEKVSMLYTYTAITSFISRHLFCKLGDFRYFNRYYLYQGGTTIGGLCILCLPAARSFVPILMLLMGFGLMEGAMNGQISLLLLDCVGHHKLNRAWGYTMLFAGISAGVGPPLVGLMADKLGSYTIPFYTAGAVHIAGASIISLMACVKQRPEETHEVQSYDEELLVAEKITVL